MYVITSYRTVTEKSSISQQGPWRKGSAADSRSAGWEFESLRAHSFTFVRHKTVMPTTRSKYQASRSLSSAMYLICDQEWFDTVPEQYENDVYRIP